MQSFEKNSADMEKYKLALEIFDHPERFSDDELRELLNDKEILEVYNLLAAAENRDCDKGKQ